MFPAYVGMNRSMTRAVRGRREVPFIARYRKEKTGGLDDTQLRKIEERLGYLRQLEDRRATVLKTIAEQGKLTPELQRAISAADNKVSTPPSNLSGEPRHKSRARAALSRWPSLAFESLAQSADGSRQIQ